MPKRGLVEIEDAILAALAPLAGTHGVRRIAPYGGEMDPDKLAQAMVNVPAVLVAYDGSSITDHGSRSMARMAWTVVIGMRNPADLVKAKRGDEAFPGVYAILDGVRQALEGKQLFPELLPAVAVGDASYLQGNGYVIHLDSYEITQAYLK